MSRKITQAELARAVQDEKRTGQLLLPDPEYDLVKRLWLRLSGIDPDTEQESASVQDITDARAFMKALEAARRRFPTDMPIEVASWLQQQSDALNRRAPE
jgi:acyl-CoA reductase-like NAD-dependent aldehyde dehydrogenase